MMQSPLTPCALFFFTLFAKDRIYLLSSYVCIAVKHKLKYTEEQMLQQEKESDAFNTLVIFIFHRRAPAKWFMVKCKNELRWLGKFRQCHLTAGRLLRPICHLSNDSYQSSDKI